ncbi:MAG: Fe-S center protein [Legionellaceae bacterium]|nr:Fe-S center protein [Legionellaceae bacterium]HAF87339.1 Fe-S center protein [Legionellales bacterium]HCA88733.1 Fe-S center protein [Legionellales bacterium]|tara:strand:- start:1022 stop:1408 length:387 start_codon:yes stop_codon:yes gene_type:complete
MTQLDKAVIQALKLAGSTAEANKAYLEFIKANFLIPVDKRANLNDPEVLYLIDGDKAFLPVFSDRQYFDNWARDIADDIDILHLTGVDLLKGLGEQVIVCLNIGSTHYKEFNCEELARMRSMVLKLFK